MGLDPLARETGEGIQVLGCDRTVPGVVSREQVIHEFVSSMLSSEVGRTIDQTLD